MKNKLVFGALGVVIGLAGLSMVAIMVLARNPSLHGSVIDPPQAAPALVLPGSNGQMFDVAQNRGKVVLIFFGYTSCTDICPATMAELHQVTSQLGKQVAEVRVVFVTVDPQRDTMEQMRQYLATFDPAFIGLTGSMDQLNQVWKAYGVYRQIQPNTADPKAYTVDHTSYIYVIDPKGRLRLTYDEGASAQDILQDVQTLLSQG